MKQHWVDSGLDSENHQRLFFVLCFLLDVL